MARTQYAPGTRKLMLSLAELVAEGTCIADAGRILGLTKGQTANAWRNIKNEMGAQTA